MNTFFHPLTLAAMSLFVVGVAHAESPCPPPYEISSVRDVDADANVRVADQWTYLLDAPQQPACVEVRWSGRCEPGIHLTWTNRCERELTLTCDIDDIDQIMTPEKSVWSHAHETSRRITCEHTQDGRTRTYEIFYEAPELNEARANGCGCTQTPRRENLEVSALLVLGLLGLRRKRR